MQHATTERGIDYPAAAGNEYVIDQAVTVDFLGRGLPRKKSVTVRALVIRVPPREAPVEVSTTR